MHPTDAGSRPRVTFILADSAQVAGGKLYILGGGWNLTSGMMPSALALLVELPWTETNKRHTWKLELQDEDGHAVAGPEGKPFLIEGTVEAGRPAGHPVGTPIPLPLAVNMGPMPLPAGRRFVWVFTFNGMSDIDWSVAFNTGPGPLAQAS